MKKSLAFCLTIIMVMSISVTAFAVPNGFLVSPSGNPAPGVVTFDPKDDDCTASLIITPYGDRHDLPDDLREIFEEAYEQIVGADDIADLNDDLKKVAEDKNIDSENLAVSDLFNLHAIGCDIHDDHYGFDIVLEADTLNRFVGLVQLNSNGEWELITNAQVIKNGNHLKFTVDYLSPLAIIIDTTIYSDKTPQTGDNSMVDTYAILMALSALAIVFVLVKGKKQKV